MSCPLTKSKHYFISDNLSTPPNLTSQTVFKMAPHASEDVTNGNSAPAVDAVPQNGTNGQTEEFSYAPTVDATAPYKVLDQYHSKPTKLRVACIGAGASGLCTAYKMERQLVPGTWELTLFEKNPHFGGTWYENTYPGVACDVSHLDPQLRHTIPNHDRSLPISTPSHGTPSLTGLTTMPTEMRSSDTLRTLPSATDRRST